jgi:hypothetical protein
MEGPLSEVIYYLCNGNLFVLSFVVYNTFPCSFSTVFDLLAGLGTG